MSNITIQIDNIDENCFIILNNIASVEKWFSEITLINGEAIDVAEVLNNENPSWEVTFLTNLQPEEL